MKVTLERIGTAAFSASGDVSNTSIIVDGSPTIGGEGRGPRPTELFLAGLGGCAAMDVVHILTRQREPLEDLRIEVIGTKSEEKPSRFVSIHLRFTALGDVHQGKLERAVALSVEKYCTVRNTLDPAMPVTWEAIRQAADGGD